MAIDGFSDTPLVPGMLTGFRTWKVERQHSVPGHAGAGEGTLCSVSYTATWRPGVNHAKCLAPSGLRRVICDDETHVRPSDHESRCYTNGPCAGLDPRCGCGFWAYTSESSEWFRDNPYSITCAQPPRAYGIIDGFGRCVVGPRGFRASSAMVRALVLPVSRQDRYHFPPPVGSADPTEEISECLRERYSTARIYDSVNAMRAANPLSHRDLLEQS